MHTWVLDVLAGFSPNDHSHCRPRAGQKIAAPEPSRWKPTAPARPVELRFITSETETAAKIVSIASRQKRP